MKKVFLPLSLLTLVMVIAGIQIYQTGATDSDPAFGFSEIIHVVLIAIIFLLGLYIAASREGARKKGLPEDDELSHGIVHRAAAFSFFASLFVWLILLFVQNSAPVDTRLLFGYGFIGMTILFVVSWSVLSYRGIERE